MTSKFLSSFVNRLRQNKYFVVGDPQQKRQASVAILLRLKTKDNNNSIIPINTFKCNCNSVNNQHSVGCLNSYVNNSIDTYKDNLTAQIFYAKKSQRGRRKGEVCFPGGHLEKNESPQEAAEREANEEIGIDLKDSKSYSYLGRLDDRITFDKLVLYSFVYLQLKDHPITFTDDELDDFGWVDIDHFFIKQRDYRDDWSSSIEYRSLSMMSSRRLVNPILKFIFSSFKVPVSKLPIHTSPFNLWGLSLELTSDLFKTVLDYTTIPSIEQSNNRIVYHMFYHPKFYLSLLTVLIPSILYYTFFN